MTDIDGQFLTKVDAVDSSTSIVVRVKNKKTHERIAEYHNGSGSIFQEEEDGHTTLSYKQSHQTVQIGTDIDKGMRYNSNCGVIDQSKRYSSTIGPDHNPW